MLAKLIIIVSFAGITGAQAALIAYEGFGYSAGTSLTGQTGGSGFSGAWASAGGNGQYIGATGSLVYTGSGALAATGNRVTYNQVDYTDNSRTFSGVSTGELWVSWLYSVNNATAASSYSGLTLNPNAAEELYFGDQFGSGQFVAADSAGETTLFSLTSGQVYFLIAQIQFNTSGSADTIKLYLNGNTANPIYTKSTINVGTLNAIGFGASVNSSSFDEIRVGTALGDIALVPEPGAITWIAAGLAVVGVGRRCRVNHLM